MKIKWYVLALLPFFVVLIAGRVVPTVVEATAAGWQAVQNPNGLQPPPPPPPPPPIPKSGPRPDFERDRPLAIRADSTRMQGNVALYRGNVRMETEGVVIQADELDFNTATREADLRGAVRVRVLPTGPKVQPLSN